MHPACTAPQREPRPGNLPARVPRDYLDQDSFRPTSDPDCEYRTIWGIVGVEDKRISIEFACGSKLQKCGGNPLLSSLEPGRRVAEQNLSQAEPTSFPESSMMPGVCRL